MMNKRILSLTLLFALIITLVSCFGKPENFPVELGNPIKISALSPINSASYGTEDSENVKKLVDMLNACTYKKHEKELEPGVDYEHGLYNPWHVYFIYKNGDNLFIVVFLEGYVHYYHETNEIWDTYKISGFDKEIFCDAIGLEPFFIKDY